MPFNSSVEAMFQSLRADYINAVVGSDDAAIQARAARAAQFDIFKSQLESTPYIVSAFNDAQETKDPKTGRSNLTALTYDSRADNGYQNKSSSWNPNRHIYNSASVPSTGTLRFNDVAIQSAGTAIPGTDRPSLTTLFIAAHELAHAKNALNSDIAYQKVMTEARNYIESQPQGSTIDITSKIRSIYETRMVEEVRANLEAYNDFVSSLTASGHDLTNQDLVDLYNSTNYAQFLIKADGSLVDGIVVNSQTHLASLLDEDLSKAVLATEKVENRIPNNHLDQYVLYALNQMCALPSTARLSVNSKDLGFDSPEEFFSLLNGSRNSFSGMSQACVIVDTANGRTIGIPASPPNSELPALTYTTLGSGAREYVVSWPNADGLGSVEVLLNGAGDVLKVRLVSASGVIEVDGSKLGSAYQDLVASARRTLNSAPILDYGDIGALSQMDTTLTWGGVRAQIDRRNLSYSVDQFGNIFVFGKAATLISYDPRTNSGKARVDHGEDGFGRQYSEEWDIDFDGDVAEYSGRSRTIDGGVVINSDDNGFTTIRLINSDINIDFVDAAEIIATTFGRYFIGSDAATQIVTSAAIKTLASNFGDVLNTLAFDGGTATSSNISHAFDGIDAELVANLKSSAIGALSSFLAAELFSQLGINGVPGQLLTTEAGLVLNNLLKNIANGDAILKGITGTSLANAAGSFVGTQLANAIADWDEIGEQIGAQIGSALGAAIGSGIPFIGTAIGAFFGDLIGGFIGGLFTGKPESGGIVNFDSASGAFIVEAVWKKAGGKLAAAQQLGDTAALSLNQIIRAIDGTLLNPSSVDGGSYGMRGKSFVFWFDDYESDHRTEFASASDLVEFGVMRAASEMQFIGGDIYTKRAFYATMERAQTQNDSEGAVGLASLVGNLTVAQRLEEYLGNTEAINAIISAEPNSGFSAEWLLVLTQSLDLGLLKRTRHDWDGGFSYLLKKGGFSAREIDFEFDSLTKTGNGERVMSLNGYVLQDTIDSGSKTVIFGSGGRDVRRARPRKSRRWLR